MTARDTQRARVYAAEEFVRTMFDRAAQHSSRAIDFFGTQLTLPPEAKFGSVAAVQRYVDDVLARVGAAPVTVRARRGAKAAHYEIENAVIAVPEQHTTWALRELVVFFGHFTAVYSTIPVQRPESHDGGCRNRAFGCP
ncbi:TIGR04338 family metallohydrolase [Mycolicibacterium smegmatis]|uniref:TIGR04338 family metallohydrolase n=1 Tax=Mycolicibacterium smegmatis TaxID=1772 RepID=UPI001E5AE9FB|nr:TIGR04338 family metallohydrolase [Mycolicibacterium smegmatis]